MEDTVDINSSESIIKYAEDFMIKYPETRKSLQAQIEEDPEDFVEQVRIAHQQVLEELENYKDQ